MKTWILSLVGFASLLVLTSAEENCYSGCYPQCIKDGSGCELIGGMLAVNCDEDSSTCVAACIERCNCLERCEDECNETAPDCEEGEEGCADLLKPCKSGCKESCKASEGSNEEPKPTEPTEGSEETV